MKHFAHTWKTLYYNHLLFNPPSNLFGINVHLIPLNL